MGKVKIELAPRVATHDLDKYVQRVCDALGHPEAWTTDESKVSDFLGIGEQPYTSHERRGGRRVPGTSKEHPAIPGVGEENVAVLKRAQEVLGIPVRREDYLVSLARSLRERECGGTT